MHRLFALLFLCFFSAVAGYGQTLVIEGHIRDQHSEEVVPFASVQFRKAGTGKLADSSGRFFITAPSMDDTLDVTSVGYQDFSIAVRQIDRTNDSGYLVIRLVPGKIGTDVVIKTKVNRGLWLWKRIVVHKPDNDRYRFRNFSYELYNKLELDLNNINAGKLSKSKLLKPFSFVFDNVDTTEGKTYLPTYLTEAISDYYYQKNPLKRREVFKAVKTIGLKNESISRLLGGMDQNVNFYNNFIPVFDKQFISPISDNGDAHYNYKVADTQYVGGRRLIHFLFFPKRKGENTFEGDCWVHDTSFAIQKMNLRLGKDANVNFVNRLSLIQEYALINDNTWFLSKDKFVVDVNPVGKNSIAFIGRKTTTYRNVVVDDTSVVRELARNKRLEEIILPEEATAQPDSFWTTARHEDLTPAEQKIYNMVDTLVKMPAFQRYTRWANFIGTGYMRVGKMLIGPWQNWMTRNSQEGIRVRFDLGTNSKFSKKIIFHGYGAYGFGDRKFKGEIDAMYLPNKKPRLYFYGEYVNDFDYGQAYFDQISSDNIFALASRKGGVPIKFIRGRKGKFETFKEWNSGFSVLAAGVHKTFTPIRNLPAKEDFVNGHESLLTSFEASVRLRFAYLEKFIENTFYRSSLGSPYPIVEMKYTRGISGIFKSRYNYDKLSAGISNFSKIPPFGTISFNVFGGRTFGTLPYVFLDIAPGNEIYYYDKYAYNLMNRYEYVHDRYAGVNVEHNFGNGIFRLLSVTRKLKFRQFWTAKALWGSLSDKNRQFNTFPDYRFSSLDGKTYLELGTGVDNILRVFRVDFIWKVLPQQNTPTNNQRFGVFGSVRFGF